MFAGLGVGEKTEVWRKAKPNQWGELPEGTLDVPHPALSGFTLHHSIDNAVFGPRTAGIHKSAAGYQPQMYSGITMFVPAEEDVDEDDIVRWKDTTGAWRVFRVEASDSNDFVSPWTGFGGKEVHVGEIRPRKSVGRGE